MWCKWKNLSVSRVARCDGHDWGHSRDSRGSLDVAQGLSAEQLNQLKHGWLHHHEVKACLNFQEISYDFSTFVNAKYLRNCQEIFWIKHLIFWKITRIKVYAFNEDSLYSCNNGNYHIKMATVTSKWLQPCQMMSHVKMVTVTSKWQVSHQNRDSQVNWCWSCKNYKCQNSDCCVKMATVTSKLAKCGHKWIQTTNELLQKQTTFM